MLNRELRETVRRLRQTGLTYNEINFKLAEKLPKSTISGWCNGIALTPKQINRIDRLKSKKLASARLQATKANHIKRQMYLGGIKKKYKDLSKHLVTNKDLLLIVLAVLYLTEGSKQPGKLTFGNSDPGIIQLYLKLLRLSYETDDTKFRCTVQCRADQKTAVLERFWSEVTGITLGNFYTARIDFRSVGKKTLKPSYMGVCRIDYFSANIYNELRTIASLLTSGR